MSPADFGAHEALLDRALSWMRTELSFRLEEYIDSSRCSMETLLGEAYLDSLEAPLDNEDAIWEAAVLAFEPYRDELNE